jgi:hypothetical protein
VLSQQALAELGGENRRRSTLAEQLGVADNTPSAVSAGCAGVAALQRISSHPQT